MTTLREVIERKLVFSEAQFDGDRTLVIQMQEHLRLLGLYLGEIDGIFGKQTDWANTRFCVQSFLNCPETDKYGATWARKLLEAVPRRSPLVSKEQAEKVFTNTITEQELLDLNNTMHRFSIKTLPCIRHFMAQIAHESGGLRWMVEWGDGAAYEGREDLGNLQPGDGERFKGVGPLQLTGRNNYRLLSQEVQDPRVMEGWRYVRVHYPFTAAGVWWRENQMNELISGGASLWDVSCKVNRGFVGCTKMNGWPDRQYRYDLACQHIK